MSVRHIIIVHGLQNKPVQVTHTTYCINAILDGFTHAGRPRPTVRYPDKAGNPAFLDDCQIHDAYWADWLYKNPLHDDREFQFDELYDDEPYTAAGTLQSYEDGLSDSLRRIAINAKDWISKPLQELMKSDGLLEGVMKRLVRDLAIYYDPSMKLTDPATRTKHDAREGLQSPLRALLEPKLQAKESVVLIAHSMGTIIAYDLLRKLGQVDPAYRLESFITLGSPLGLDLVQANIEKIPGNKGQIRTPTIVKSWLNFSDKRDVVAADCWLSDDYAQNSSGVKVKDDLVWNDYSRDGKANPHKLYGYLRCPEFTGELLKLL